MSPADLPRPAPGPERTGYVVKVYPRFSETFVVTELLAREAAGEQLAVYALRPTTDARFHPQIARVAAPVSHLPRPAKLSEGWAVLARAQAELPGFAERFGRLLPATARMEASDVVQGVDLALRARADGLTHLHAHFANAAARVAHVASALTGIPYTVTTHAKDLFHADVDQRLLDHLLDGAAHVVAISDYNRRFLLRDRPHLADRVVLVRNGLDLTQFPYTDPTPVDPAGPLRVAAVGRLVEKKGFALLVDAAARLAAEGRRLEVRIAGDGDLRADLELAIAAAGLGGSVQLLGPRSQDEVRALLAWADVLAAPCVVGADGNADGLPTVLLEAMACGVPVVASDVTGIPEAVRPATPVAPGTGLLVPAGDVGALSDALRTAAEPGFDRAGTARAARTLVEAEYDTVRQSRRLAALQHPAGRPFAEVAS